MEIYCREDEDSMNTYAEGNFLKGLFWGSVLSLILWISVIGWIKLVFQTFKHLPMY